MHEHTVARETVLWFSIQKCLTGSIEDLGWISPLLGIGTFENMDWIHHNHYSGSEEEPSWLLGTVVLPLFKPQLLLLTIETHSVSVEFVKESNEPDLTRTAHMTLAVPNLIPGLPLWTTFEFKNRTEQASISKLWLCHLCSLYSPPLLLCSLAQIKSPSVHTLPKGSEWMEKEQGKGAIILDITVDLNNDYPNQILMWSYLSCLFQSTVFCCPEASPKTATVLWNEIMMLQWKELCHTTRTVWHSTKMAHNNSLNTRGDSPKV